MEFRPQLDSSADVPLYRQLGMYLRELMEDGELHLGDRLPPTRELAAKLGLNRTTVSAAYDVLESQGLIKGEVGRGSYVSATPPVRKSSLDWPHMLTPSLSSGAASSPAGVISFASSRPSERLFPVDAFRESCLEVLGSKDLKTLMQLGAPEGYEPLRRYLFERAKCNGIAHESDDILITNGCQQALDLLRRALIRPGDKVAVEEPVYPGLKNLFLEAGADLIGVPAGPEGLDLYALKRALDSGAKVLVITPSFQNPTGATLAIPARLEICRMAKAAGAVLIENDIYSETGCQALQSGYTPLPRLKGLDANVILLGSFSKVAFPGTRVGWMIAPRPVIARAIELKQLADLHTDHLSQAFLLRFAETGRLARHQHAALLATKEKLKALEQSSRRFLPGCTCKVPGGGMNMWVTLPGGLDSAVLRGLAQHAGIDYMPGRHFSVSRPLDSGLRLSFGGLDPREIRTGVEILGKVIQSALDARERPAQPAIALV